MQNFLTLGVNKLVDHFFKWKTKQKHSQVRDGRPPAWNYSANLETTAVDDESDADRIDDDDDVVKRLDLLSSSLALKSLASCIHL